MWSLLSVMGFRGFRKNGTCIWGIVGYVGYTLKNKGANRQNEDHVTYPTGVEIVGYTRAQIRS
jgi:hypothetical protein